MVVHDVRVRTKFGHELDELANELALMSTVAHEAVDRAAAAVEHANLGAAYEVLACDEQLKTNHRSCQGRAMLLLALQAPVARDLRHVVTGIQIADDLSQIGSLASQVADAAYRCHPAPIAPPEPTRILADISRLATELTAAAARAVATQDAPPDADPDRHTDAIAELNRRLVSAVTDPDWDHTSVTAVTIALLGTYFQRCGDHAVRIGQRIHFYDTGIQQQPR